MFVHNNQFMQPVIALWFLAGAFLDPDQHIEQLMVYPPIETNAPNDLWCRDLGEVLAPNDLRFQVQGPPWDLG